MTGFESQLPRLAQNEPERIDDVAQQCWKAQEAPPKTTMRWAPPKLPEVKDEPKLKDEAELDDWPPFKVPEPTIFERLWDLLPSFRKRPEIIVPPEDSGNWGMLMFDFGSSMGVEEYGEMVRRIPDLRGNQGGLQHSPNPEPVTPKATTVKPFACLTS